MSLKDENGGNISLNVESRTDNFGDPSIVFVPKAIDLNTDGKKYSLTVSDVMVNGKNRTYTHEVTIINVQ